MIRQTILMLTGVMLISAPALAQPATPHLVPTDGEPFFLVGLAERDVSGTVRGGAYSDGGAAGDDLTGIVYMSPCQTLGSSSNLRAPAASTDVWKLGGRIASLDADATSIEVRVCGARC